MSPLGSSTPLSSTISVGSSIFSWVSGSNSSLSHISSQKIRCTINVDTEKLKRQLNTKGKPPEARSAHRLQRKETQNVKQFVKTKKIPEEELLFAEDSEFKAAFDDYIKVMDDVKRNREHQNNEEEKTEFADKRINLKNTYKQMNLKANYRGGDEKLETYSRDSKRKVRFKEFYSKNFKASNVKIDFITDNDFNLKPYFTIDRGNRKKIEEDSMVFNAKPGLKVNVGRRMGRGGLETKGNGGKQNARLKGEDSGKLREKLGNSRVKNNAIGADVGDEVETEHKAFLFCTDSRPRFGPEDRARQLAEQLNSPHMNMSMWDFSKLMYSSKVKFTNIFIHRLVQVLGDMGNWRRALQVVEWLHSRERYQPSNRRYIYTTVLSILGKARRPNEALNVFHAMREEFSTYPDMPAYHSIAVTLGQAGYIKELLDLMACLQAGPDKKLEKVPLRHWDPCLHPDEVIYNALINACVPHKEWEGAIWVLQQMRHSGIRPTTATYGLVMEVMLTAGKYDMVHKVFDRMEKSGICPNGLTYKALVQAFWREGKIHKALCTVGEMERRGIIGAASLYYEIARCLCSVGRCKEALLQVEKICRVGNKPPYVAYTGLIKTCMECGHLQECTFIFHEMQKDCAPNIITCNMMMKLYAQNHMFKEAKSLFQQIKNGRIGPENTDVMLKPDRITYTAILEACAMAQEWDYFETVYQNMLLEGYQFDNKKHSSLIVAASKAGKRHLLKSTYEQLVEMGRTPHALLYKELICQNLLAGDYATTFAYIKSMARAQLNIRKSEWIDYFEKNDYLISQENLQGLLNEVNNFGGGNDRTSLIFKNFMNSLQLLNEQCTQADTRNNVTVAMTN